MKRERRTLTERIKTRLAAERDSFIVRHFNTFERLGIHALPNNWFFTVPDTRELSRERLERPFSMVGIDLREAHQLELLEDMRKYADEFARQAPLEPTGASHQYFLHNVSFGQIDGFLLWSMLRMHRPRRILEVGCGNSTLLAAQACVANAEDGHVTKFTTYDPFPDPRVLAGPPGLTELLRVRGQDIPLERFEELEPGDVLFIDSTHCVEPGSDVVYLFLEALPRVRPGVWIHVHDVFLPNDYPTEWVLGRHWFWNEQYLLHAYLLNRPDVNIDLAAHFLSTRHRNVLQNILGPLDTKTPAPSGFWFHRRADG